MKRLYFLTAILITAATMLAEDFKVGDIKYTVTGSNTVEVSDAKKTIGNFILPSEVENKKGLKFTVTSIGKEAFKGSKITSIEIPNSVNSIGIGSFMDCKELKTIELPKSISVIPEKTFSNCKSLNSFSIPGVKRIETEAFYGCTSLEHITIPANVEFIASKAFNRIGEIKTFVISPSENSIDADYDVLGISKVDQLTIGRNWEGYGITNGASYIILNGDVTHVDEKSLKSWINGKLKNIKIETADYFTLVESIINNAPPKFSATLTFGDNENLGYFQAKRLLLQLGREQQEIEELKGEAAGGDPKAMALLFKNYYDRKKYNEALTYLKQLNEKGSDGLTSLKGNYVDAINCCMECKEDELAATIFGNYMKSTNSMQLKPTTYPQFQFVDKDCRYCYYGSEGAMLLKYSGNSSNFTIPSSVKDSFGKERYVEALGDSCCYEASFTSLVIPSTVNKIGLVAFYGCKNLTKVNIGSDKFIISGQSSFKGCDKLKWANITYPYFKTEEVTSDFGTALNSINYTFGYDVTLEFVKSWVANHSANQCYTTSEMINTGSDFYESYLISYVTKFLLLKKAVTTGNTDAQLDLCGISSKLLRANRLNSSLFTPEEIKQISNTFIQTAKSLAAKGNAGGLYYMGWAYEYGFGVGVSKSQAHSYYGKARDKGVNCTADWKRTR